MLFLTAHVVSASQQVGTINSFRLLRDTLDFIYARSSDRNIPVAQVIEGIADALKRQQARLGVPELTAEQGAEFPFPLALC